MSTIRIKKRLDSENLPELRPFLGKEVEIIVSESEPQSSKRPRSYFGIFKDMPDLPMEAFEEAKQCLRKSQEP